jgi:hypothetical protein
MGSAKYSSICWLEKLHFQLGDPGSDDTGCRPPARGGCFRHRHTRLADLRESSEHPARDIGVRWNVSRAEFYKGSEFFVVNYHEVTFKDFR